MLFIIVTKDEAFFVCIYKLMLSLFGSLVDHKTHFLPL